jgi:hypothetical protein
MKTRVVALAWFVGINLVAGFVKAATGSHGADRFFMVVPRVLLMYYYVKSMARASSSTRSTSRAALTFRRT